MGRIEKIKRQLIEESNRRLLGERVDNFTISDMVKKDQEMRQNQIFDVDVDLTNQKQIKMLINDDPQKFLESLNDINDVEGLWLIAQHADNDVEFQKTILSLLLYNKDVISHKFNVPIKEILNRIAMLTDRVMVNTSTGLKGYRDNDLYDFSEVSNGKQKYGTQGGVYNKQWMPRPIEIGNRTHFFQTTEELYNDKDFLGKINRLRDSVGLPPLEDYVRNMQKYT